MAKRASILATVAAIGSIAAGVAVHATTAAAQEFKWKMQSIETPTGPGSSVLMKPWLDMIKEATGGRLEITYHTADEILPAAEILNGLKTGIIEMAFTTPLYYTGTIPESFLNAAAMPPMILKRSSAVKDLYWNDDGLDSIMREAYDKENVYFLNTIFAGGSVAIWSCREPVRTLEDLKGFKFRSFGKVATVFEKLGAAPVFLPHPEVYTAISQGIIDGSTGGSALFQFNKYYELCKYFYNPPVLEVDSLAFMINKDAWNSLPPDIQQVLKMAGMLYSDQYQRLTDSWQDEMKQKFAEWGTETIEWPPELVNAVREEGLKMLPEMKEQSPGLAKGIALVEEYAKTH
jgi:TRAP-type C4-dicarboxylate transport system substrate-binding protein